MSIFARLNLECQALLKQSSHTLSYSFYSETGPACLLAYPWRPHCFEWVRRAFLWRIKLHFVAKQTRDILLLENIYGIDTTKAEGAD